MNLEQKINYQLNKYPFIKKGVKRVYQLVWYSISKKVKCEGDVMKMSPDDKENDYFFGYYDKCPWDATGRYMLCMKAKDTWSEPDPLGTAEILLLEIEEYSKGLNGSKGCKVIATTHCWNVQQGCMAQWLGPDFMSKILYNDLRDGKYVSVILDVNTFEERVLPMPCYTVSADGKTALSLDFSRLHSLRLGYGYAELPEVTKGMALPDTTAVWMMDIETGEVTELLKYTDFANFQPRPEIQEPGSVHKVNHLMLSPNGKRFMVLYRWFCGQRKYTRLVTCNVDGTDMYVLSDDDMVSHCYWKNDEEIIAFERKKEEGTGYYLMKDKTQEWKHLWKQLSNDGHPSYCPTDENLVLFDTYPDRARVQEVKIARDDSDEVTTIAKVFAPFKYDNDTRCDCHPRWSRDGKKVAFDSTFEGRKGLYVVNVKK
ncbi:TolB family protein [Prevotella sp.]|uniref:TolB family protein n=1 Tax=Prevotella sp. TaxID=59823 RepID=UPI002F928AA5